jgi:ubiquinone/menaquinone biosynthesis C-methylase UbiE
MVWYEVGFKGPMVKYWEQYLLQEYRDLETQFIQGFLKKGLVLDINCGPGAYLRNISSDQEVVGLDLSRGLLLKAREGCKKKGTYENVSLIRGDMRKLPFRPDVFDDVVHIQAFGYFSDKKNESVLSEIYRTLKEEGKYVQQINNYPRSLRPLKWKDIEPKKTKDFIKTQTIKYKPKTKRLRIKEYVRDRRSEEEVFNSDYKLRIYTYNELKRLHRKKGFNVKMVFGLFVIRDFEKPFDALEFDSKVSGPMTLISEK